MNGNWPLARVAIIDPRPDTHEAFHKIFAERCLLLSDCTEWTAAALQNEADRSHYLLPGAARRNQPFLLRHAHDNQRAVEMMAAACQADERFALAFIAHAATNFDGLEIAQSLWRVDPNVQVVICLQEGLSEWPDTALSMPHSDQMLLLRDPPHPLEVIQVALTQSARWRTTMEVRDHIWRLQSELDLRLETEARLRQDAEHDALTKLPNRIVLLQRLEEILQRHAGGDRTTDAVLFMDLDNFKGINDTLGHAAGDELLNQVANRLRTSTRSGDDKRGRTETVRLGGDEFVVLLEQLSCAEDAITVAKRIVDRMAEPFRIDDRTVRVGSSVGVAFIDQSDGCGERLLQNADTAMYRAKLAGKGQIAVYDRGMHDDITARLEMEAALRSAIENQQLDVLFQPAISLTDGRVRSLEALLRWKMSDNTSIPPSRFIPLAEELGVINEIGYWAIDRATQQLAPFVKRSKHQRTSPVNLNVNLSHHQLWERDFERNVGEILDKNGFPRAFLKLEITEEIAMRDPRETAQRLYELHMAGFGICMDDFGSGHSSLAFFHQFPIETVKIDREFVSTIAQNHSHQAIVEAVIRLAHSLNATVVAEGLESIDQVRLLMSLGCDLGQGYCFAPPMRFDAISQVLGSPLHDHPWANVTRELLPECFERSGISTGYAQVIPIPCESSASPLELP